MSVKKFKFVSPGVFTKEIDNSQLPAADRPAGPVIVGRLPQGPAMEPVKISSFAEYVEVFGNPVPGKATGDVWRDGNYQGPTYAAYAAQAYLRNSDDAITVVRLAGQKNQDAGDAGRAGWGTVDLTTSYETAGSAYGLFLCNPSGTTAGAANEEGYLAAVWYFPSGGAVSVTGTLPGGATAGGIGGLINPTPDVGSSKGPDYTAEIHKNDALGTVLLKTKFNFDPSSRTFIRKVFNTNPQATGDVIPASTFSNGENLYWLGETYESFIQKQIDLGTLSSDAYGLILPFENDGKSDYRFDATRASTGWFFSQDLSTDHTMWTAERMQKLFKLHALEPGKWIQDNLKVSIQDLTYSRSTTGVSPYSSFTVIIRRADDTDNVVETVERFSNCNLNPLSDNYIAKKIGDKYRVWSATDAVLREYGEYSNASKYVRVEVDDSVANGIADPSLLPFGVYGPERIKDVLFEHDQSVAPTVDVLEKGTEGPGGITPVGSAYIASGTLPTYGVNMNFPEAQLRISSSAGGLVDQTDAYFGLNAAAYLENTAGAYSSNRADAGYADYVYPLGSIAPADKESQWAFSLDNIVKPIGKNYTYYQVDARKDNLSFSATGSWRELVDDGWDRFTAPLFGGFDGLNVVEIEPFNNNDMASATTTTSYALNTLRQSIDLLADPEVAEYNLLAVPGITNTNITDLMLQVCADRGDALAIVDIQDVYTPFTETSAAYSDVTARAGTVSTAIRTLEDRQINNSYGCTYYPWVQVQDTVTSNSRLWVPPSVVALGTFASSAAQTEVWFAPAGFNRGGLSQGSAGIPVLNVSQRLTSKDRDALYDANVNPIASFPNEGIVIFGQKTLQLTPSALDRINVRRMMIFVKRQISIFANSILFDQNVEVTWNRFKSLAVPFLASVQTRLGLSDYKLILDKTTTTPDLVDRNIVYAKIFLKPAKAIEYIALDFVITNQGAAFED
jgi:hypothetical protein